MNLFLIIFLALIILLVIFTFKIWTEREEAVLFKVSNPTSWQIYFSEREKSIEIARKKAEQGKAEWQEIEVQKFDIPILGEVRREKELRRVEGEFMTGRGGAR